MTHYTAGSHSAFGDAGSSLPLFEDKEARRALLDSAARHSSPSKVTTAIHRVLVFPGLSILKPTKGFERNSAVTQIRATNIGRDKEIGSG